MTLRGKLINDYIHKKLEVAPSEDKMRETRLRWFGHVQWWPIIAPIRNGRTTINGATGTRGRLPPKAWDKSFVVVN